MLISLQLDDGPKGQITTDFDKVRLSVILCEFHLLHHKSTSSCLSWRHIIRYIWNQRGFICFSQNILSLLRPLGNKDKKKSISLHMSENVPAYLYRSQWKIKTGRKYRKICGYASASRLPSKFYAPLNVNSLHHLRRINWTDLSWRAEANLKIMNGINCISAFPWSTGRTVIE